MSSENNKIRKGKIEKRKQESEKRKAPAPQNHPGRRKRASEGGGYKFWAT
jgi:hypothetical protein